MAIGLRLDILAAADFTPGPQHFLQEIVRRFADSSGLPSGAVQLIESAPDGVIRAFAGGKWYEFREDRWRENATLTPRAEGQFVFADAKGQPVTVAVPWGDVRQLARFGATNFLATPADPFMVVDGKLSSLGWPSRFRVNQIALSPEGTVLVASSAGLFRQREKSWEPIGVLDNLGRAWAVQDVLGVALDSKSQLWFATKAGVGCGTSGGWKFYEGKDGLPWNDFTGITSGSDGEVWFGTRLGVMRFDGREWQYRQGPRWLPHDDVAQVAIDGQGHAWFATAGGVCSIERRTMRLADKAEFYEQEIERYIKRTHLGFVAEAHLRKPGDKSSADPQDSDNDGLWTAMYGAGECFAYGATQNPKPKERAKKAFEALRFLQKVTQGGTHSPPKGYIARTVRPAELSDPNIGRLERDREEQKRDKLWKVYEPRWPKSADGKWFWKSDTSSDELDGHYFFYGLYYEFCADTDAEKARVREVVRDVTDHLLSHGFVLIDHDGRPTRWAVYGPQFLNRDPMWWPERGLNSLSVLSYLAVAAHITGDGKYEAASRDLIDQHGYAHNSMYPKVQNGPGSGNQSDDEMAFMSYYSLLRYSKNETLKGMIRYSFFRYWVNETSEMNPFFNFAYAAHNLDAAATNPWGSFALKPWPGWHENSMKTLHGFPLDRFDWPHKNSHRLDVVALPGARARDLASAEGRVRGHRVNGKVLPIENRHFGHWNTDPWQLDYGGNGGELAAGTVFLLPYYLGVYHGFIERPDR
jgi:hypothetical protein